MKICFWGDVAGALRGKTSGGGELQIALMAKALRKSGNEVTVLDREIEEEFETDEGIKVLPIKGWKGGIRMIRTFTHQLPGLYFSLIEQNADIYYCRIRNYRHIFVYLAARKINAKFVLGLASDLDILSIKYRWKYFYKTNLRGLWIIFDSFFSEIFYPVLIRKSDLVLVQHTGQQELLRKRNVYSVLFPNLIDSEDIPPQSDNFRKDFVYVGSLIRRKGFLSFIELVRRTPEKTYTIIGIPREKADQLLYEEIKLFKNVSVTGRLCHSDTLRHIANSKALISTSPMEGFPNIFIEAWACGVPVLSLYVDPGGVIKTERLGAVANGNIEKLIEAMDCLSNFDGIANRAMSYVEHNHLFNSDKINRLNTIFSKLLKEENNFPE